MAQFHEFDFSHMPIHWKYDALSQKYYNQTSLKTKSKLTRLQIFQGGGRNGKLKELETI